MYSQETGAGIKAECPGPMQPNSGSGSRNPDPLAGRACLRFALESSANVEVTKLRAISLERERTMVGAV